jgi:hypothetical protein
LAHSRAVADADRLRWQHASCFVNVKTGVFLDSAVKGLSYRTDTQSGLTNALGEFKYLEGEVVTFKIGNVNIGSSFGADVITPLDITNTFEPSDKAASDLLRLLQTLDSDNNADNGIDLPANVAALTETLDIADTAAVEQALGTTLVAANVAETHLSNTLATIGPRAIDGVYQQVSVGKTLAAGCSIIDNTVITVSRNSAGARVYEGVISLSNGGQYRFTEDDSSIRNPTIVEDSGHDYYIRLDKFHGVMRVFKLGELGLQFDCSEIRLTTNDVINLPPVIGRPLYVVSYPSCVSTNSTYGVDMYMGAYDKDGFLINDLDVEFSVEDGDTQTLTHTPVSCTGQCGEHLALAKAWDPADPGRSRKYYSSVNSVMENIPCTSGFSWEAAVTDNEILTTTLTGGNDRVLTADPVTGSRNYYQWHEYYPAATCDIVKDNTLGGQDVTSHSAGSCNSLVPDPKHSITSSQTSELINIGTDNVIIDYGESLGSDNVSCLIRSDVF